MNWIRWLMLAIRILWIECREMLVEIQRLGQRLRGTGHLGNWERASVVRIVECWEILVELEGL